MAYGTKYRLDFTNDIGEDYEIYFNRKGYQGDYTLLIGASDTLNIRSLAGDDDPFAPIVSKECVINMHIPEGQSVSITDFLSVEDDDWQVTVSRDPAQPAIFNGFLVVEDSSEPFYDRPYSLQVRASDGLPLLKNVPLKATNGNNFTGNHSIITYVTAALYYLNPEIPTKFYYNISHPLMTSSSPLAEITLDARTFEKGENVYMDCYTVLEMIMTDLNCRRNGSLAWFQRL